MAKARRTAAALFWHSSSSAAGSESATIPAPACTCATPVAQHRCADRDRGVHVTGEVEVPDASGVQAPPAALEFVDDLHGARLRGAATGCRRGTSPPAGRRPSVRGASLPTTVDTMWWTWEYCSTCMNSTHVHGARAAHPPEVVAPQVHEHQVLSTFLRVGQQICDQFGVLVRGASRGGGYRRWDAASPRRRSASTSASGLDPTIAEPGAVHPLSARGCSAGTCTGSGWSCAVRGRRSTGWRRRAG